MSSPGEARQLAILWSLSWDGDRLSCVVYRTRTGMLLRVESPKAVVITEPFELQPKMLARARALRDALKRRGWQDAP